MKKRIISILLTMALLCALMPAAVLTASAETYSGACGNNLTWTLDTATGVLEIAGTGEMSIPFVTISESRPTAPWDFYKEFIKTTIIGNGVTSIGSYAFYGCTGLTSVTIPDSVTSIGDAAFYDCTGLTSVTIPESVTSIGDDAFYDCPGLTSVTIPESVTSIGELAFGWCSGLTSVTIPDGVTSIGELAFGYCTGLTSFTVDTGNANYCSVNGILYNKDKTILLCYPAGKTGASFIIPDSVTSIGVDAFYGCTGLTSVTIPESVTSIGEWAFYGCTGLTSVTIPDSVTSIGDDAFLGCTGLTSFTVDTGNANYCSVNGILYNKDKTILLCYPAGKTDASFIIPDGVTSIGDDAFYDCSGLTSVTIPDSVTSIGESAFGWCTGLTSVTIGNSVTSIGESAFGACFGLTSVTIPESVTSIGGWAFVACFGLTSVTISKSVMSIEASAFMDCFNLTDVYYYGSEEEWNAISIGEENEELTEARIHYNYTGEPVTPPSKFFSDIPAEAWFSDAVQWAVANDVTNGTSATTFSPDATCTRAQVVTFLYRAAGEPAVKDGKNPFTDVKESDYFYTAVLWAVEHDITAGTSATTFSPEAACTRAQVVTFLWRYEGEPEPASSGNPFTDVKAGAYYEKAVLWAAKADVTTGTSATTFSPDSTCTRAQIVTFLYRDIA